MTTRILLCSAVLALSAGACVTTGTFEKAQADAAKREAGFKSEIARLKKELAAMTEERDGTLKRLDDSSALVAELKARLEKLGQNVDKLSSEKGELATGLADARRALEELRKQKALAEQRAAVFRNLVEKLRSMIDSGKLKVVIRRGRMLIALPNDVLFDSGKTELKIEGKEAISQVAAVLATIEDRRFLVAGHTDDVPIKTARFPSNWELSTARAIEVTKILVAAGMKAERIGSAGYSEFDPVIANDSPEHRAQNRRIEIILEPNLSDLPSLEGLEGK